MGIGTGPHPAPEQQDCGPVPAGAPHSQEYVSPPAPPAAEAATTGIAHENERLTKWLAKRLGSPESSGDHAAQRQRLAEQEAAADEVTAAAAAACAATGGALQTVEGRHLVAHRGEDPRPDWQHVRRVNILKPSA